MANETESNASVSLRHTVSLTVGAVLTYLVEENLISNKLSAILVGFLPSLAFNIIIAIRARIRARHREQIALALPPQSTSADVTAVAAVVDAAPKGEKLATLNEAVDIVALRESGSYPRVE